MTATQKAKLQKLVEATGVYRHCQGAPLQTQLKLLANMDKALSAFYKAMDIQYMTQAQFEELDSKADAWYTNRTMCGAGKDW